MGNTGHQAITANPANISGFNILLLNRLNKL